MSVEGVERGGGGAGGDEEERRRRRRGQQPGPPGVHGLPTIWRVPNRIRACVVGRLFLASELLNGALNGSRLLYSAGSSSTRD